jgi:hypothetical protein
MLELRVKWTTMGWKKRNDAKKVIRRTAGRIEAAKAAVEAESAAGGPKAKAWDHTMVTHGKRKYITTEDVRDAKRIKDKEHRHRISAERLNYRLHRVKGCSVENCPLGVCSILKLIHSDHVDAETKVGLVTQMKGLERDEEMEKTVPKCRWHHFLHTREQRNDQPFPAYLRSLSASENVKALIGWKNEVGCQHPLHSEMPYASLVPSAKTDPLVKGFLEISHVVPGTRLDCIPKKSANCAAYAKYALMDLNAEPPRAYVHCSFCHGLYTLCEEAMLYGDSPYTKDQFSKL